MNNLKKKPGLKPAGERKKEEVLVPVDIHPLAISQARAFANLSRSLAMGIKDGGDHGELLAYLVNAGLSIELYLKALMIGARAGRVTKGHDLDHLYQEFPAFLRDFLESAFSSNRPAEGWDFTMHALIFSARNPPGPGTRPRPQFETFAATLSATKDACVRARYFFERVNGDDWAIFEHAPGPLDAAMLALDSAYQHLLAGSFAAGRDMIAGKG
jgi:hypothetical protein